MLYLRALLPDVFQATAYSKKENQHAPTVCWTTEEVACCRKDFSCPRPVLATRTSYIIYRAHCKIKMWGPLLRNY